MGCKGTCQIEEHAWRKDRLEDNPYNGAPHTKPGSDEFEVDVGSSEEEIWQGENLSQYTDLRITMTFDYSSQWEAGVERQYPRDGRALNCTESDCVCDRDWDNPTVVEDWPKTWTRYVVHVRHVERRPKDGDPTKELVTRLLLKGAILHRKRVIQGLCKDNPNIIIVPPLSKPREEGE